MSSPSHKQPSPLLAGGPDGKRTGKHGNDSGHASQTKDEVAVVGGKKPPPADRSSSPTDENMYQSAASYASAAEEDDQLAEDDDQLAYEEAAPKELLPPPDFKPFFTLIEGSISGEHHHPTVHYLFSDDDQEMFADATLMAIAQTATPGEQAEVEERIVVLDMAPDGKSATTVKSLSPTWQALTTVVGQAPSWGDSSNATDGGLMLKIAGQEASDSRSKDRAQSRIGSMEEMIGSFGERLEGLDEVIGKTVEEGDAQEASTQEGSSHR
ncbi:hypothetical protein LTR08_005644 [Meristemomyces frigidus]|nr:hypothetical protein LTR08_005644 [Meristemomyces frigidus]